MTLKDFKKVKYNKKMRDIKQRLDELESNYKIVTLYNCYNDCSVEKMRAYDECREFYYLLKYDLYKYEKCTHMQIVSYNTFNFTIAFIIDNKLYYITKDSNLYCEMGE